MRGRGAGSSTGDENWRMGNLQDGQGHRAAPLGRIS